MRPQVCLFGPVQPGIAPQVQPLLDLLDVVAPRPGAAGLGDGEFFEIVGFEHGYAVLCLVFGGYFPVRRDKVQVETAGSAIPCDQPRLCTPP